MELEWSTCMIRNKLPKKKKRSCRGSAERWLFIHLGHSHTPRPLDSSTHDKSQLCSPACMSAHPSKSEIIHGPTAQFPQAPAGLRLSPKCMSTACSYTGCRQGCLLFIVSVEYERARWWSFQKVFFCVVFLSLLNNSVPAPLPCCTHLNCQIDHYPYGWRVVAKMKRPRGGTDLQLAAAGHTTS